jgi:type IV secretory pathway VirB2 component (pilin)
VGLIMLKGPLLVAFITGIIILALTWWFKKKDFPFLIKILPGTITLITAAIIFYIS